jgi:hypothetical protein
MVLMAPVWFLAITGYFRYLRECQPDLYREMGEPSILTNNNFTTFASFLQYVCGNRYLMSGDLQLISKSLFLKRFFLTYLIIFFVALIAGLIIRNS